MAANETVNRLAQLIDEITGNGLEYLLLTSMISSDNINSIEDAENSLKQINEIERALPHTNIPEDKVEEYKRFIKKGKNILNNDIKRFKEEKK